MRKNITKKSFATYMPIIITLLFVCLFNLSCIGQSEKYRKIVHMPLTALSSGAGFETKTHNGYIDVKGSDVTDCNITATIIGYAATVESAEEIVEKTKLTFEHSDGDLILKIDKPLNLRNRSVSVNLDIILPSNVDLNLETHNGKITIENISGNTVATTHNGKVIVENLSGSARLETHNGQIEGEQTSGNIEFHTHNGSIKVRYLETAAHDSNIELTTHNGSIELNTPPNYSARANISTHNGHIDTKLPIAIEGQIRRNKLTGTIGDGQGELELETHNGSIKIR